MNNQRGDITLMSCLLIFVTMSLVLLCSLELKKNFRLMEQRTKLFLCAKETKGEFHEYMKFMGRTNWGIKNIEKAAIVMMFIPGAQGAALSAKKLKKLLKHSQNIKLVSYLKTLHDIKKKGCDLDPRLYLTPFHLNGFLYSRDHNGAAKLRKNQWKYYFLSKPYLLSLEVDAGNYESINPKIKYISEEKGARLSSLLSLR